MTLLDYHFMRVDTELAKLFILGRRIYLNPRGGAQISSFPNSGGMAGGETYQDALNCLNNLQSGFAKLTESRQRNKQLSAEERQERKKSTIQQMEQWLGKIGYTASDLDKLNVIHVAGTNGKGSTCAYIEQLLAEHRAESGLPQKIGLYTSPHLTSVCERFRTNGAKIAEKDFAKYFFEVYRRLRGPGDELSPMPVYFRFLTLLSFHIFIREGVDAAIYETGVGGEFDSTNIIPNPVVTGITSLSLDHCLSLGPTIEDIAWNKAGILKGGCPAFSVPQEAAAENVLEGRAKEKNVGLHFISVDSRLEDVDLDPKDIQDSNASLALKLAGTFLYKKYGLQSLPKAWIESLQTTCWSGRFEIRVEGNIEWYLDGAHNEAGLEAAGKWFVSKIAEQITSPTQILVYNQESQRDREYLLRVLYRNLHATNSCLQHVIFCTNTLYESGSEKIDLVDRNKDTSAMDALQTQRSNAQFWREEPCGCARISIIRTIEEAIGYIRAISDEKNGTKVLVTGSIRLVGGALTILNNHKNT